MINGVIEIVAAVLFAVVFLSTGRESVWLWVAGFYLVCGVVNLLIHTFRNRQKLKAAQKQAQQSAPQSASANPAVPAAVEAPEAEPADAVFQELEEP